jgi:hypothetical protein
MPSVMMCLSSIPVMCLSFLISSECMLLASGHENGTNVVNDSCESDRVPEFVERLRFFRPTFLDSRDKLGNRHLQRVANEKENVEGGRFLVVFELRYVRAMQTRSEGKLLLGQTGSHARFAKFVAKHP